MHGNSHTSEANHGLFSVYRARPVYRNRRLRRLVLQKQEMTWLLALIPGPVKRAFAWALGGAVALLGVFLMGRREGTQRARERALRDHQDTRERMDDAEMGDDPAAANRWLRERERQRNLSGDDS